MRKPDFNMSLFEERRIRLRETLNENKQRSCAVILFANHEQVRNHDVHHAFRQDTNFFYLTGFEEPDSVYIFRPNHENENTLFVRKKDALKETWDGFRYGTQGAKENFYMDQVFELDELYEKAAEVLSDCDRVYYDLFLNGENDKELSKILKRVQAHFRRSGKGLLPIYSSTELLGEQRVVKATDEIELQLKACEITTKAHIEVMKHIRPGMNERELHGVFLSSIMRQGSSREGYGGIFAAGNNATTLHYVFNDQEIKDGDFVLVDAGAEHEFFSGDITRCFPANGQFSSDQKRVYNKVLEIQKALIDMVKPGISFKELNDYTSEKITELLMEEGVLQGEKEALIHEEKYKSYYPHGVSHYLGMDVHDAGLYKIKGEPRPLEEGMIFTIEPGIYFPENDQSVPKALRGLGIRIEDNILVTKEGHTNLTQHCPKEVDEIEALMKN